MKIKEYAEIKKIFLYNFFALCLHYEISDAFIIETTHVTQNNLDKYRHHNKPISEEKIFAMAKVLELPMEKIFTSHRYEPENNE